MIFIAILIVIYDYYFHAHILYIMHILSFQSSAKYFRYFSSAREEGSWTRVVVCRGGRYFQAMDVIVELPDGTTKLVPVRTRGKKFGFISRENDDCMKLSLQLRVVVYLVIGAASRRCHYT